uniref:CFAP20 domain containing n=1 Tax=Hippocampus comes TaxID=109280 RepID=A0A3Q2YA51_HIPCM
AHPPRGKVLNKQASERRKLRVQNESSLNSAGTSSISPPPTPAEPLPGSTQPASSPDPQVRSCWESNDDEPELRLTLQEEVFTFASPPHSPKGGQGRGERKTEMRGDQVQSPNGTRGEAQPEDDFIGSESDEEKSYSAFPHRTLPADCTPDISQCLDPNLEPEVQPEDQNTEQTTSVEDFRPAASEMRLPSANDWMASGHCHSTFGTRQDERCGSGEAEGRNRAVDWSNSASLSRSRLQEVSPDDPFKVRSEEDDTIQPGDRGDWHSNPANSLQLRGGDDAELQMLASLQREREEEDERKASGLSASQIHQCNVSMSLSSEDTSTWTHTSVPENQGHHYQKEMNALRGDESEKEEEVEDEYLNLLYDPCLNCYFDPETGKYYELA